MEKFIYTITGLLFLLSTLDNDLYSQVPESYCGDAEIESFDGIPKRSPVNGEFYRVLILYVAFSDDEADSDWNIWAPHEPPVNPYTSNGRLIDTTEMDNYTDYTYSKWFEEMSRDSFDFIGNEVLVTLPNPSSYYNDQLH